MPGGNTGLLLDANTVKVEEIINKSVGVFLPAMDPFWKDHIVSNQSMSSNGEIGKDYKILKTFQGGLTGVIEPGGPKADFGLYGDAATDWGSKMFSQGLTRTFPDPRGGMNQKPFRLGIPLRTMNANIMFTLGELQMEATEAVIGEIIAPKLEGFSRNMALFLVNSFWTSQNNSYQLATARTGGWSFTLDTSSTLMLDLTYDNYAVDRFQVGQRVEIGTLTGTPITFTHVVTDAMTTAFDLGWVVTAVDELSCKVYFKAFKKSTGALQTSLTGLDIAAGDIVVPFGIVGNSSTPFASNAANVSATEYFTGIAGIRSWLKFGDSNGSTTYDGNTLLGAESDSANRINVNTHPEFRSMRINMANQALTEHKMRSILRRWHMAKLKYGKTIDCLVASDGVWLAYEATKIGREILNRTGRLSDVRNEGSGEGFRFEMDGRSYTGYTSSFIESGTVYGFKKGSNWKRYVPNDQKGTTSFGNNDAWIPFRFVAQALGMPGTKIPIFMGVGSTPNIFGAVTEGAQMPGWLRMQLVPEQPDGLLIENVAEDRTYSL